jgi:hypothetical protein
MLFIGLIGMLFIILLQGHFQLLEVEPLQGSYGMVDDPAISKASWFDGSYQEQEALYINQNFGFRSTFVRSYNQWYFSRYNQARANGVIIGKEDYLYEFNYIAAALGRDYIGEEAIADKVYKLNAVSKILHEKDIKIMVLLAPGKGSFYSEFIPDIYEPERLSITNYDTYKKKLDEANIKVLDMHQWFMDMKGKTEYPLFPKTGIHWSKYGEVLVLDSLVKYINALDMDKRVATIIPGESAPSKRVLDTDDDIERGMNLLFDIPDLAMGYTPFETVVDSTQTPAKVLSVADSYYWGLHNWGVSKHIFNDGQFWFYNEQIYPDVNGIPLKVSEVDLKAEVEKNDVILLLSTDANLYRFAFGFIDQLYAAYFDEAQ